MCDRNNIIVNNAYEIESVTGVCEFLEIEPVWDEHTRHFDLNQCNCAINVSKMLDSVKMSYRYDSDEMKYYVNT